MHHRKSSKPRPPLHFNFHPPDFHRMNNPPHTTGSPNPSEAAESIAEPDAASGYIAGKVWSSSSVLKTQNVASAPAAAVENESDSTNHSSTVMRFEHPDANHRRFDDRHQHHDNKDFNDTAFSSVSAQLLSNFSQRPSRQTGSLSSTASNRTAGTSGSVTSRPSTTAAPLKNYLHNHMSNTYHQTQSLGMHSATPVMPPLLPNNTQSRKGCGISSLPSRPTTSSSSSRGYIKILPESQHWKLQQQQQYII